MATGADRLRKARTKGGQKHDSFAVHSLAFSLRRSKGMLRSPRAVQVNIAIMRVFVRLRETLALHKSLARKAELESRLERDSLSASIGERARVRCRFEAFNPQLP